MFLCDVRTAVLNHCIHRNTKFKIVNMLFECVRHTTQFICLVRFFDKKTQVCLFVTVVLYI